MAARMKIDPYHWQQNSSPLNVLFSDVYRVGQKMWPLCFMAFNFRNIEQIFTRFGINHSHFILNIMP